MSTIDLLAIFPHPDDAELTCGGTLLKTAKQGYRVGILDLSAGEMASRGSVSQRSDESTRAAQILRVSVRENLGFPDSGMTNTPETRLMVARVVRRLKPTIVITTAPSPFGRHPDHRITAELVRDACFVAGLKTIAPELPAHRPRKVIHSITYREDYLRPTFVVDVTEEMEATGYPECRAYRGCPLGKAVAFCSIPTLGHWVWDDAATAAWTFFERQ